MLEQLLELTQTGEFEDNGSLVLQRADWRGDSLDLAFRVEHGTDESSSWELRCSGIVEYLLTGGRYQIGLNVWSGDHPLIDQYVQPRESVYIAKAAQDPDSVVGQLWSTHTRLVDDWFAFDRYLNREQPLANLLASGSALIATAPAFLAAAYRDVLASNACEPAVLRAGGPHVTSAQLAHFGDSYVVARQITASRSAG